jgi:predicted mannosyl-3-phosphoglycerate phosphatase (HAD superfamily)
MPRRFIDDLKDKLTDVSVIYTDLDGTMLGKAGSFLHDPAGHPTLEPAQALLAAQLAGIEVVPNSGRALRGLQTDGRLLGMPTVIAEMGALISYDFGADVVTLLGDTPEGEDQDAPAAMMKRLGVVELLLERYSDRLEHHLPWANWRSFTQLFRGLVDPQEVNQTLVEAGFGWLELHDNGRLHGDYLGLGAGASRAYHLIPTGMSKAHAVEFDMQRRNIPRANAVAVGDAFADLLFAQVVGVCVIVGDALDHDPTLEKRCAELENVAVTKQPQNLGWAELLRACVEAKS